MNDGTPRAAASICSQGRPAVFLPERRPCSAVSVTAAGRSPRDSAPGTLAFAGGQLAGGTSTLLMTWTTPLEALTSAFSTVASFTFTVPPWTETFSF